MESHYNFIYNPITTIIIIFLLYFTHELTFTCLANQIQCNPETNTKFLKSSCRVTKYPNLCFKTLSPYTNSIKSSAIELANVALNVTLKETQTTLNNITELSKTKNLNPREANIVSDCVENLDDSVSELRKSLTEMKNLEGPEFEVKMGNVMTWVSAALTYEDTCMDGFESYDKINEKIKESIKRNILYISKLTSNALALINNISSTQVDSP